jgi:DNA polymerase delta subunit 1
MNTRPDPLPLNPDEPVTFMCTDVTYAVPRQIRLWGTTAAGNTVCVKIEDFLPYFYFWFPQDSIVTEQEIKDALEKKLHDMEKDADSVKHVQFVQRTSILTGYNGKGHERFGKVTVASPSLVKDCRSLFEHGQILTGFPAPTYEASIQFVLRFMIDHSFGGCDWLEFRSYQEESPNKRETTAQYELRSGCANLIRRPDLLDVAEMIILSFDIEACKFKGRGFVDAATDPVTQIGYQVISNKRGTLADCCISLVPTYEDSVAEVPGIEIIKCYTREDVLRGFRDAIKRYDPDIITGYNIDGFDWMYLFGSAKALNMESEFAHFSRDVVRRAHCKKVSKQSKGGGARIDYECSIEGRMSLDTYKFIKSVLKLRSYALGNVSNVELGYTKVEMSYKLIPVYQMGTDEQRAHLCKYCHWDAKLCLDIWKKRNVLMMYVQNARANQIPLKYLVTRGQEIRGVSMVTREANAQNIILPSHTEKSDRKPQGALVLPPKKGMHTYPIVTLDYQSLYPSNIIWKNICWITFVLLSWARANLKPDDYVIPPMPGINYGYVKPHVRKGLLPEIEKRLHLKRLEAKAMMKKYEKGSDMWVFYNELQIAIKLCMNSLYGFTSAHQVPKIELTESVTGFGRFVLEQSKWLVERNFPGATVIYGDSVVADTPVLIKNGELIQYVTIEEMPRSTEWTGNVFDGKEYANPVEGTLTWTDQGWTPLVRIMRHKTNKLIYRVTTESGSYVSVTEDHSLLDLHAKEIKPSEVKVGDHLLHHEFPEISPDAADVEDAYDMGTRFSANPRLRVPVSILNSNKSSIVRFLRGVNDTWNGEYDGSLDIRIAEVYFLTDRIGAFQTLATAIKRIENLGTTDDYVYDLETGNHHFAAGVGKMIVHNTDSIFVCFGDVTLDKAFELGSIAAKMCTDHIGTLGIPNVHLLQREKAFLPFLMIDNKKYAGRKTLGPGLEFELSSSGLENVRRDNAPILSETLDEVLEEIIMKEDTRGKRSVAMVHQLLRDLLMDRVSTSRLIISKNLSKTYKHYEETGSLQPHVEVAKRKAKRGDELAATGDRVKFVFLAGAKGAKAHEKAEDPMYALLHKLTIDTEYYIYNQLLKPLLRIFTPILAPKESFKKVNKAGKRVALNDKELHSLTAYKVLFTGNHMTQIVQKTAEGTPGTMLMFAKKTVRCLGCKTPMTAANALCKRCKSGKMRDIQPKSLVPDTPIEDYIRQRLAGDQAQLVTKKAECLEICRLCAKDPTATEIPCANTDCNTLWERTKTAVDLEDLIERIKRF